MGTKKTDKEFLWLKVLHLLEDLDKKSTTDVHEKLKELNKVFYIRERK